jgi:hypothetical protein
MPASLENHRRRTFLQQVLPPIQDYSFLIPSANAPDLRSSAAVARMAYAAVRIGARDTLATLVQGRCVVAAENAVSRSAWIDLTQRLQDRRVHRPKRLFVSDMHPDVRPRDIQRQTVGARAMMQQSGTAESQIKAVIEAWADAAMRAICKALAITDAVKPHDLRRTMAAPSPGLARSAGPEK